MQVETIRLVLPESITYAILQTLHSSQYLHLSAKSINICFSSLFYCPNSYKIALKATDSCVMCIAGRNRKQLDIPGHHRTTCVLTPWCSPGAVTGTLASPCSVMCSPATSPWYPSRLWMPGTRVTQSVHTCLCTPAHSSSAWTEELNTPMLQFEIFVRDSTSASSHLCHHIQINRPLSNRR